MDARSGGLSGISPDDAFTRMVGILRGRRVDLFHLVIHSVDAFAGDVAAITEDRHPREGAPMRSDASSRGWIDEGASPTESLERHIETRSTVIFSIFSGRYVRSKGRGASIEVLFRRQRW